MKTEKSQLTGAKYWWLALLALCFVPCVIPIVCKGDPRKIVAGIPIDSKLSELDEHLGKFYDDSNIEAWGNAPTETRSTKYMKAKFGFSYVRDLGKYDSWTASKSERDAFTGRIEFYHYSSVIPDDLAPSYVVTLIYVNGALKEKDFGFLPG